MNDSQSRRRAPFPVLPPHGPGLAIGLFGGSFNPPHEGHRLASLAAMKRLGLDRVWWIVTPGNPLKDNARLPQLAARLAVAKAVADHPRIDITGFEAAIGTRFTYDTLAYLRRRCPRTRFVWIMGADNLATFHRWQNWRGIAALMPIAIIDRPGATIRAARAPAAVALHHARVPERNAAALPEATLPAWIFLHGPRSAQSSTALRARARGSSGAVG
ncbi:nicotinate-nucleotide adenylyltransferase [Chelatococcus asaccharovorans]|uniref:nicotinate-nucleotide adenylyltransferase n=1 Tax=Chelatococcus asaccharovorans TaxID=28210 RepID=UPI00224C6F2F|nr:nicotinate-nucleotide adenylyltransferase [Chelatococcus asaccharovorans]CAH1662090.1 putative nicotinate-nucleotide adenylyltransferase [Chelatococcus asaccharovorans]CAH1683271.1 putative nicotinate-nucleotide adenylyltransferase [Chelatococcus asaccharovorans]